jgi:hypothetical protein
VFLVLGLKLKLTLEDRISSSVWYTAVWWDNLSELAIFGSLSLEVSCASWVCWPLLPKTSSAKRTHAWLTTELYLLSAVPTGKYLHEYIVN